MSFLIDTNVFLEIILDQEKSKIAQQCIQSFSQSYVTDFSIHSIGLLLFRRQKEELFNSFLKDTFENTGISIIHLDTTDMQKLKDIVTKHKLDFDDAYQYVAAEKNGLQIISFDHDFDNTELGRKDPSIFQPLIDSTPHIPD